jgi:hypothetical protein
VSHESFKWVVSIKRQIKKLCTVGFKKTGNEIWPNVNWKFNLSIYVNLIKTDRTFSDSSRFFWSQPYLPFCWLKKGKITWSIKKKIRSSCGKHGYGFYHKSNFVFSIKSQRKLTGDSLLNYAERLTKSCSPWPPHISFFVAV